MTSVNFVASFYRTTPCKFALAHYILAHSRSRLPLYGLPPQRRAPLDMNLPLHITYMRLPPYGSFRLPLYGSPPDRWVSHCASFPHPASNVVPPHRSCLIRSKWSGRFSSSGTKRGIRSMHRFDRYM